MRRCCFCIRQDLLGNSPLHNIITFKLTTALGNAPAKKIPGPKYHQSHKYHALLEMEPEDSPGLCQICRKIKFSQYFQNDINSCKDDSGFVGPTEEALKLGLFEELFHKFSICNFCRLVVKAICRGRHGVITTPENLIERDRRQKMKTVCWVFSYCYATNTPFEDQKARRIGIATRLSEGNFLYPENHQGDIQLLAEDAKSLSRLELFYGRALPAQFDMQLARDWLSHCENDHVELCETSGGEIKPQALRVIDVKSLCVCYLPLGARYVALSYCWTANNPFTLTKDVEPQLFQPGSLTNRMRELPQTIQDAIHCVSDLKERYLWVDSICIIQDCEDDKRIQISQMDKVYGSAVLTLVSAYSYTESTPHPSRGLSRYNSFSGDIHQEVEQIQGLRLAVPLPTISTAIKSSRWNKRAWTFQEALLSRRILYFTDIQVYFQCSCSVFCEDCIGEGSQYSAYISPASNLWNMGRLHNSQADNVDFGSLHLRRTPYSYSHQGLNEYQGLVTNYTDRDLSRSSDILNAFAGLEAVMKKTLASDFWYGLPEAQLDSALLWTLTGHHKRRKVDITGLGRDHFPSWSWAGWESPVELGSYFHITGIRSEVDWYLISQTDLAKSMSIEQFDDEIIDFVEENHKNVRPLGNQSNTIMLSVESRLNVNTQNGIWRYPKYLACWTTLAPFQLSGETKPLGNHGKIWNNGYNLRISDGMQDWVGSIMMDEKWATANLVDYQEFEFMLMSRSEDFYDRNPPPRIAFFDEEVFTRKSWCLLNVMLIEREGNIGTRLGVGVIHEDAWAAANPKALFIKLT